MEMRLMNLFTFLRSHQYYLIILVIYLISRLIMLHNFPLFFDEAIYIRWAQNILDDSFWKWVSLIDGKQPLFIWIITIFHSVIKDPVLAGRIVSVTAGLFSMTGIYILSKELNNKSTGIIASCVYLIIPFYLLYDSLALMDSLLMTLSIFSVYFSIRLAKEIKIIDALLLGITIGLGLLTKSSAQFFFFYPLFTLLIFKNFKIKVFGKYCLYVALSFILATVISSIMMISTYYPIIAQKNSEFSKSFEDIIKNPLDLVQLNVKNVGDWIVNYLSFSVIIISIFSGVFIKKRVFFTLILCAFIPIAITILIGKQLYPRHFLFMTWPFVILLAYFLDWLHKKYFTKKVYVTVVILALVIAIPMRSSFILLINPLKANLVDIERWQFFEGEPSGIGLDKLIHEIAKYESERLLVLVDKPRGILPDGIGIHFYQRKNVVVDGTDQITKTVLKRYVSKYHPKTIVLITSQQDSPIDIASKKVFEIQREGEDNKNWKVYIPDQTTF